MAEHVIEIEVPGFDPEPNVAEPVLVQSEHECFLVYWDREFVRRALRFTRCGITKCGYPNDDGRWGHPLYSKGLRSYGVYEVFESEWLVQLRMANAQIFPNYVLFEGLRHLIFSFHDSTFECIAEGLTTVDEFPKLDAKLLRISETL